MFGEIKTTYTKKFWLIFSITISLLVVGGMSFILFKGKEPVKQDRMPSKELPIDVEITKKYWRKQIKSVGGDEAYKKLKRYYADSEVDFKHTVAHIFGAILYKTKGVEAVSTCDRTFRNGCYHEVIGRAISEHGTDIFDSLATYCEKQDCFHGVGHGLVAAAGYDKKSLEQSLNLCRRLPDEPTLSGCVGGVFMEYNLRTISPEGRRSLSHKNKYEPCESVKKRYEPFCYYEQVRWWQDRLYDIPDPEKRSEEIIRFCNEIPSDSDEARMGCFRGIGEFSFSKLDWNISRIKRVCQNIPSEKGTLSCLSGSYETYLTIFHDTKKAQSLCAQYAGKKLERCQNVSPLHSWR